jgi:trehalose-6-phosphatase
LEHLDLDEEEANKIAMAMEKGRRNAVLLDWGGTLNTSSMDPESGVNCGI